MSDFFFKSRIQLSLLRIFFSNHGKEYYIRELAKIVNTSAGNTDKELKKMEKEGILISVKKANLRFFSLNKSYPLYKELNGIITKTVGIEIELKKQLEELKGLEFAFIFGSYVKGNFKSDSDLDLYLIGDIAEDDLIERIKEVEKVINREINFHVARRKDFLKNLEEKYFYQEILQNYILLTENEDEFRKFIK